MCCACCVCQHCQHCQHKSDALNAMHVDRVNTKHMHTFLLITFLIFNWFPIWKKNWKIEIQWLSNHTIEYYVSWWKGYALTFMHQNNRCTSSQGPPGLGYGPLTPCGMAVTVREAITSSFPPMAIAREVTSYALYQIPERWHHWIHHMLTV